MATVERIAVPVAIMTLLLDWLWIKRVVIFTKNIMSFHANRYAEGVQV
jgi:hypothetical protein